jgi:hypothetical protein
MYIKICLFLVVSISCYSQKEPLEADRPDQTETPSIVPKGMFQVESGFTFQKNTSKSTTFSMPSTLWKYGISTTIELRLITEFIFEKDETQKQNGLLPVAVGFKINLMQEKGWLPKTSLISHVSLKNWSSSKYKYDYYVPDFRFTMQHKLGDNFCLGYNLGAEWDGFTKQSTALYTLTTGYSINEKLGSYLELFGFAPQNEIAYHNFDGGFTYLINNNFMVDLSSGFGITQSAPKHYFALGVSFRI